MRASIITPTFNAASFIDGCVANVAAQGSSVAEHVIVDGGSTDGTVEKVQALMAAHPHLRFIPGPDKGQADAMNKGTKAAKAEVIGFLNVDDFYEPGAVADALQELATFRRPGIVIGDCRIVDEDGNTIRWNRPKNVRIQSLLQMALIDRIPANPSAYFYHRDVHDIVGGYDMQNHYSMDVDFVLGAARLTSARYVPKHWGNFRMTSACKTFKNASGAVEDIKDPLPPILERHLRALRPVQKASMPLFNLYARLLEFRWTMMNKLRRSA